MAVDVDVVAVVVEEIDVVVTVVVVVVGVVVELVMVVVVDVADVVVTVVVVVMVVVVLDVLVVVMHESHNAGQYCRTCFPAKLSRLQEAYVYGSSCPHSTGSTAPLHNPVVVVVVAVLVVEVAEVVVVEATQESHATGQRVRRSGKVLHWANVTPLHSGVGSGVRSGFAPLQSSQIVPDHGPVQVHLPSAWYLPPLPRQAAESANFWFIFAAVALHAVRTRGCQPTPEQSQHTDDVNNDATAHV